MNAKQVLWPIFGFALLMTMAPSSAWASRSETQEALVRAETVVNTAERNNAGQHAPMEMKFARDALAEARIQAEDREWERSRALARRAIADAMLAEAKGRLSVAERSRAELAAAVEALRNELSRSAN